VLPTFALTLAQRAPDAVGSQGGFNTLTAMHGAQQLRLHRELPRAGELAMTATVTGVWDKGATAVFDIRVDSDYFAPPSDEPTWISEWGADGIRVNAVAPHALSPGLKWWTEANPEEAAEFVKTIPLGRVGDCERDIGRAVAFLVGADAGYLTGATPVGRAMLAFLDPESVDLGEDLPDHRPELGRVPPRTLVPLGAAVPTVGDGDHPAFHLEHPARDVTGLGRAQPHQ